MDFFQAQERARTTSRWLVFWFAMCLAAVVITLYLLAAAASSMATSQEPGGGTDGWWDPQLFAMITVGAGGIILLGSLYKLMRLSGGGAVVARDLGGRQVDPSTTDFLERRLINVVEEMSIASGLPAPEIWILDEERGINAFAAGTDPANAVVGVTRGCLERLTRDELQGVVAHEFSHILNGDMKLNMRLIGWVFGLVMIAMLGRMLLQLLRFSRGSRDSKGGGAVMALVAAGLALWLVGSIGAFFAKLLQAGVSRQREFLADAAAVQFTRNRDGLANALRKVGGFQLNGSIQSSAAAEARHLFFANSQLLKFGFSTHPPLDVRIRAIDPAWDGAMLKATKPQTPAEPPPLPAGRAAGRVPAVAGFPLNSLGDAALPDAAVGLHIHQQLAEGGAVFHSKDEAKALLCGLLLAAGPDDRSAGVELVREQLGDEAAARADGWHQSLAGRSAAEKIALVDMSLPWLRRMSREEAEDFIALTHRLIAADGQVTLFEFMLEKVMERHVAVGLGLRKVAKIRHTSLEKLERETAVLAGALAGLSGDPDALTAAEADYREHTGRGLPRVPADECTLEAVATALAAFEAATPLLKARLLRMCGLVAMHDGELKDGEAELLRAIADAIGAPLPPMARMRAE
jgi:Zn-dependent protease with chaperone function